MGFDGEVWHLHGGDGPIGDITIDEADFPWLSGHFTPGPGFAAVQELFARELTLLGRGHEEDEEHEEHEECMEAWEAAYDEIRRRVFLSSPDGPVPEFLLHIEGERAWFRWSDEPFEE